MTTVTGAWAPNSTADKRMQLILDYTLTSTATHTTVKGTLKLKVGWSFYDSSNLLAWSGSLLGSGSKSNIGISVATGGTQTIHTFTQTVPRTSSAQGMTLAFQLSGIDYVGAVASLSTVISIPAVGSGTTPAPPPTSDVTLSRVSDSQHTVRWTAVPGANFYGLGRSINGGPYVWLGWVDAPQVTYNLTGTSSNQSVSVSVFARTASGDTPVKYSALAYTTPANASSIAFTQTGPDRGSLTWARNAKHIGSQTVQVSTNNGASWANVSGLVGLSAGTYGRTVIGLVQGPSYQFRIVTYTPAPAISNASSASSARVLAAVPDAPTNVTATRVNDSTWTVTWQGSADSWRVQRSINGGAWTNAATGLTARTATVTGTSSNQSVQFRVVARNVAGESGAGASPVYYTTPSTATISRAVRQPNGDIALDWNTTARYVDRTEILAASRPEGGVWSAYSTVLHHDSLAPTVKSATLPGHSLDLEWRFVVRHHVTPPALSSTSSPSITVTLGQRPHAPTPLAPTGTVEAGTVELRWRHNSADTSEQTAYELRWRYSGGTWSYLTGASLSSHTVTVPAGTIEWQVRTKGQHADWSDWSSISQFVAAELPTATIVAPTGSTITTNRPHLVWTYYDPTGSPQASWRLEVTDDARVVYALSGTGMATPVAAPYVSGTTYTLRLWVTSSNGLESNPAEISFTADFTPPGTPTLTVEWDEETGRVYGQAWATTEDDTLPDAEELRIERFDLERQEWVTVEGGHEVWDWQAPLRADVLYRAVATSASGGEAASDPVAVYTDTCRTYFHRDSGTYLWLESNQNHDSAPAQHAVVEHYEGDDWPTSHYGTGRSHLISLTATLWDGEGLDQDMDVLHGQDVYFRSPLGQAWWATISGLSIQQDWYKIAQLRLTAQRVGGPRG